MRRAVEPAAAELTIAAIERPAPPPPPSKRRPPLALLIASSLVVHAGVFAALNRDPRPLASIGIVSVSVELVLGAESEAGRAPTRSETEVASAPSPRMPQPERPESETPQPRPQTVPEQIEESHIEEPRSAPKIVTAEGGPATEDKVGGGSDPAPVSADTSAPASLAQTRLAEDAAARPEPAADPPAPHERIAEPKRFRPHAKRAPARHDRGTPPPASMASRASNGVGRGRSDASTDYRGLLAAHLARHKQYPSDARSRGEEGVATVTFSLDANGQVGLVRLARGSGFASLDQETQALVHRASPFPAPPSGRAMTFTIPIRYSLR